MIVAVAVDLGGTSIKAALVRAGERPTVDRFPTGRERGYDAVLDDVADIVESLRLRADELGERVVAVGIAVPGAVDEGDGIALHSVTFGWRDQPLAERFSGRFGVPVAVQHDVRAAARAEATAGAAATVPSALFVALGTGIAAATVVNQRVLQGATHRAGEIGQQLFADPAGPGQVTLEALASARGIAARYSAASGNEVDAAEVAERSLSGDPIAHSVWHAAVAALADAIASSVLAVDPSVVVLGGGLSLAGPTLLDPLAEALAARLPWRSSPPLVVGTFGPDAGTVGAGLTALLNALEAR